MEFTIGNLLTFAASAGVISAVVSTLLSLFPDHLSRRRRAKILAMKTAIEFDAFFHACFDSIGETSNHQYSYGHEHYEAPNLHIPKPPQIFIEDEAWSSIKTELAARVFEFAPWVKYENDGITSEAEHDHPEPDTRRGLTARYEAAKRAYILSIDLLNAYEIPQITHSKESYNWFLESKERFEEKCRLRDEREKAAPSFV